MKLEPEQGITPDAWVILEIQDPIHPGMPPHQKILSGWSGSYLYGDSWRLSSPIKKMDLNALSDEITVDTISGSVYNLNINRQGLKMSIAGIYDQLTDKFGDNITMVTL